MIGQLPNIFSFDAPLLMLNVVTPIGKYVDEINTAEGREKHEMSLHRHHGATRLIGELTSSNTAAHAPAMQSLSRVITGRRCGP
jgi:hypothetical protein